MSTKIRNKYCALFFRNKKQIELSASAVCFEMFRLSFSCAKGPLIMTLLLYTKLQDKYAHIWWNRKKDAE